MFGDLLLLHAIPKADLPQKTVDAHDRNMVVDDRLVPRRFAMKTCLSSDTSPKGPTLERDPVARPRAAARISSRSTKAIPFPHQDK